MDDDTTLTAPLVVPESTREPIDADVAPQAADEAENDDNRAEDALRAAAMLGLVSIGLMLVILIFFWPLIFAYFLFPKKGIAWAAAVAEIVHFVALVWIPFPYLYIHRKVCYPLRMMLMPLVHKVAKSESIREKGTSWYNKCADLPQTREAKVLLGHFKSSIRRDLRRKLKLFFERGITTQTQHSDYFSLRTDIPIIWSHEKRAVHGTDKSALEEFVKRFLVVFLVSNGYIDRYYDRDGKFCALGEFVASEKTLNNFVYFCLAEHSQSGIWQYHHFRGLLRAIAASPEIEYINFQVHQSFAKRLAGAVGACYSDTELLDTLYPVALFKEPPRRVIDLKISAEDVGLQ